MSDPYTLTVPDNAENFEHEGQTYHGGQTFQTRDPCEVLRFYEAFKDGNPDKGRRDKTPNAWQNARRECAAQRAGNGQDENDGSDQDDGIDEDPADSQQDEPVQLQEREPSEPSDPSPSPQQPEDSAEQQGGHEEPEASVLEAPREEDPPPTEEPRRPPEGERHPTHGGKLPQEPTDAGDPVDIFTGAFVLRETDLTIPNTLLPLAFTRIYRSGAPTFGPFGWNWDHNYNIYLRELKTGDVALWRELHEHIFSFNGETYESPAGLFESLARVAGLSQVFELTVGGGTVLRFERPSGWTDPERIPLVRVEDRHGNHLDFSYGTENNLIGVTDNDERGFLFEYDACGLLVTVTDHTGRSFDYLHDEQTMQLTHVISPATGDHPDGVQTIYHYEHPWARSELRHNIVRVEDADGNIYVENRYEEDPASWSYARVREQFYGGFLYQFRYTQLQYVTPNPVYANIPAVRAEVMNPDYGLETYTFNYRGDLLDRRYRLVKDWSYRVVIWRYEYDRQGNRTAIIRPDGSRELFIFDHENSDPKMRGKLLRKELTAATGYPSPSRIVWRGTYEPIYQLLVEERDEGGRITSYRYDFQLTPGNASGLLKEVVQPEATLPDGTVQSAATQFEYNGKGQLTAVVLPGGTRNEFSYGSDGKEKSRLIERKMDVEMLNISETLTYDTPGYVVSVTDGAGVTTERTFNALGQVESASPGDIDNSKATSRYYYNRDGYPIEIHKPSGSYEDQSGGQAELVDRIDRDVLGYPTAYYLHRESSEERSFRLCNDYRGNPLEIRNPDGSRIRKSYDERGLLLKEEVIGDDGKRLTSRNVYDRSGRVIRTVSPFGESTRFEYDGFSRLSKRIEPNGTEIRYRWGVNNLLLSEEVIGDDGTGTDRRLSFTSHSYDEKNREVTRTVLTFSEDPDDYDEYTTTFHYDSADRPVKKVDPRGGTVTSRYDGLGRLTVRTDAMGNETHYSHDANGNPVQIQHHHKEPDGSVSILSRHYSYDARNRLTTVTEPDGSTVTFEYDDRDCLLRRTDQNSVIREFSYNSFQDKTGEIIDPGGLEIEHRWTVDLMSRTTSYTDPTGEISTYHFDSLGRHSGTDYPNGFTSMKIFNENHQIVREELSGGTVFEFSYDGANRLVRMTNPQTAADLTALEDHTFTYDGLNRVVEAGSGPETVSRNFDSRNRLLSESLQNETIRCRYHDEDGIVEKIWPDGRTEQLVHDLNGVLTDIQVTVDGLLGNSGENLATFRTSGPDHLAESLYAGKIQTLNSFDRRKRITESRIRLPDESEETVSYRYDPAGQRRVEAFTGRHPKMNLFSFDSSKRLTRLKSGFESTLTHVFTQPEHDEAIEQIENDATGASWQEAYQYNAADARTASSRTGAADKTYSYQSGHRLQSDGVNSYSHHPDGTLSNDSIFQYRADGLGRVTEILDGNQSVCKFSYDALGRPVHINQADKPKRTLHYLGGFVEQESENGEAVRQNSIHPVTGIPVAYHTADGTRYTLFDQRFNLIGLTDAEGEILESYRYRPFGTPQVFNDAGDEIPGPQFKAEPIFGGQRYLSGNGLYLSKKRLMNPENGTFLSPDPKGHIDSPFLYAYAAQDPINNMDPNGEAVPLIVAIGVIGGALAGAGFSAYDAYHNPSRYSGWQGSLRTFGQVFAGAAIAGTAVIAGEAVLAAGGAGALTTGTGIGTGTASLSATQTFVLYGTSSAVGASTLRGGFHSLFPDTVGPVTPGTMAMDYAAGGTFGVALRGISFPSNNNTTWTLQGDRDAILQSQRIWGQTEGSVYGMNTPNLPTWKATGGGSVGQNSAIFEFSGSNNLFKPHEVTGLFSGMKRTLGQRKAGFGDLTFDRATEIGSRTVDGIEIPVYRLSGVQLDRGVFHGQSGADIGGFFTIPRPEWMSQSAFASSRLNSRRIFDATSTATIVAAAGSHMRDRFGESEMPEEPAHPNRKPPSAK